MCLLSMCLLHHGSYLLCIRDNETRVIYSPSWALLQSLLKLRAWTRCPGGRKVTTIIVIFFFCDTCLLLGHIIWKWWRKDALGAPQNGKGGPWRGTGTLGAQGHGGVSTGMGALWESILPSPAGMYTSHSDSVWPSLPGLSRCREGKTKT
jgi:hypothetical protein